MNRETVVISDPFFIRSGEYIFCNAAELRAAKARDKISTPETITSTVHVITIGHNIDLW